MTDLRTARIRKAFLDCHADGHQWRHEGVVGAPDWKPPLGMYGALARHSICTSCASERARWYTRSGEVINRYRYTDGYQHVRHGPDDEPAPTRLEYRQRLAFTLFAEVDAKAERAQRRRTRKAAS